jgi:hypothetical protein
MAVGQVSFHNDKRVKRGTIFAICDFNIMFMLLLVYVAKRENAIVNRLNKTKVEKEVDYEQERVDRVKKENATRRSAAAVKAR